jgi:hypothetical protein
MRPAIVRRPSSSIYLLEPAESKIGQEIFAWHPFSSNNGNFSFQLSAFQLFP